MGLVIQLLSLLGKVFLIASALLLQGSAGGSMAVPPATSSAISPITEGSQNVTHGKLAGSHAPSPASHPNGSSLHLPLGPPLYKPAPVPKSSEGLVLSLLPTIPTSRPPYSSAPLSLTSQGTVPHLAPSAPLGKQTHVKAPILVPDAPAPVVSPPHNLPQNPPSIPSQLPASMLPSSFHNKRSDGKAPVSATIAPAKTAPGPRIGLLHPPTICPIVPEVPPSVSPVASSIASPPTILPHLPRTSPKEPPSNIPGSSVSPSHSPIPEPLGQDSPTPSASPLGQTKMLFPSPKISPSGSSPRKQKTPFLPAIQALTPPPPHSNEDCTSITCMEPLTNTPPGSPCGCVWPMKVGMRLGIALYTFFPLLSELGAEIAAGVCLKQSQVRIIGANAASQDPEKTVVLVDLVPLGEKFDNITAYLTYKRLWRKQVAINNSFFGDYDVLYVHFPGLPPTPPSASSAGVIGSDPYIIHDNPQRTIQPLGVDVPKQQHNDKINGSRIAVIAFSASVALILCCAILWVLLFKLRHHKHHTPPMPPTTLPSLTKSSGIAASMIGSGPSSSLSFTYSFGTYNGMAKTFCASHIEKATDNFNPSRILGEGGFGRVYSGVLEDGTKVAVKILKKDGQQGGREFLAEVEMLSRLHHRNLVKLIGICTEERTRCLVYELIPNGSVESHLHGVHKETAPLDWSARIKIALGAARGLAYLHEDSSPRVIHRDFKSSNILLEHDFTPKVSDFGLARTALEEENRHISTHVMGTFGYLAPEYAMTGHLLVKSDVYSYGVVLLELLTGRKPVDMSQPPGQENLVTWIRPLLTSREGLESIVDLTLGPDFPFDSIEKVAAIASMCVQPEVSRRPFMGEVVQALKLVCNECKETKGLGSRSCSQDDISIYLDAWSSTNSGHQFDRLQTHSPVSTYASALDADRELSISDFFSTSPRFVMQGLGSLRRQVSSGP